MKSLIITLLIISNLFATELDWINEQVKAIKPQRIGLDFSELSALNDPFIAVKKIKEPIIREQKKRSKVVIKGKKVKGEKYPKKISFILSATLNKSARINGKWYKLGEYISKYKIVMIESSSFLLIKSKKKIMLTTLNKSNNISFQN